MISTDVKPTVVLADDHRGMLLKVSEFLRDGYTVAAKVSDGRSSVQAALELAPDILILDIAMPNGSGIQAAQEVRRLGLSSKIIFLTIQEDDDYVRAAEELGASFVLKSRMHTDLLTAVHEALLGRRFVSALPGRRSR
jgi:DNA-binding NarL/FixJ family response regulator